MHWKPKDSNRVGKKGLLFAVLTSLVFVGMFTNAIESGFVECSLILASMNNYGLLLF